jgi:hypothetical protein
MDLEIHYFEFLIFIDRYLGVASIKKFGFKKLVLTNTAQ